MGHVQVANTRFISPPTIVSSGRPNVGHRLHATLLPTQRCVTTLITAVKETTLM